jgi:hypothetical protein
VERIYKCRVENCGVWYEKKSNLDRHMAAAHAKQEKSRASASLQATFKRKIIARDASRAAKKSKLEDGESDFDSDEE